MSTQPPNGRLSFRNPGFRTVLAACAALAVTATSMHAAALSAAKAAALASGTINFLIQENDPTLAADAATAIKTLCDQNSSVADVTAIIKAGLGAISDAGGASLAADTNIGAALIGDATLQALPKPGFISALEGGIAGITGLKGKALDSPQAAENFVQGLLTSGTSTLFPNGTTLSTFAVDILAKVSKNTNVDELVSYQFGLVKPADVTTADALLAKYSAAGIKITQGLVAAIPITGGTDPAAVETARVAFIESISNTSTTVKNAVSIVQGAVFTDPFHAEDFTNGIFAAITISSAKGPKLLITDAPKIATAVGATLGQYGDGLVTVAKAFSDAVGTNALPVKSAATYVTDLIKGAVTSKVLATQFSVSSGAFGFGGGKLNIGSLAKKTLANTPLATANDLAAILDVMADGIIKNVGAANTATLATDLGALAKAVAAITTNNTVADTVAAQPEPVAVYLAGTFGAYLNALGTLGTPANELTIFNAIVKGITAETETSIDTKVAAVLSGTAYQAYAGAFGAITELETAVTNL